MYSTTLQQHHVQYHITAAPCTTLQQHHVPPHSSTMYSTTLQQHHVQYHLTPTPTATFSLPPYADNGDCDGSRNSVTVSPANTSAQVASHLICISQEAISNFSRDNGYHDTLFEIFLSSRRQIPGKYLRTAGHGYSQTFPNPSLTHHLAVQRYAV